MTDSKSKKVTSKRTKGNTVTVLHSCTQAKTLKSQGAELKSQGTQIKSQGEDIKRQGVLLERISVVTLGNGHEEDGILFMFRVFMKEHKQVLDDISQIKQGVQDLHQESDANKKLAETAQHAVDDYKKEVALIDKTKGKIAKTDIEKRAERRDKIRTAVTIITAFLMVVGIVVTVILSNKGVTQGESNGKRIENLGDPIILNKSGKPIDSRSIEIRMPFKKTEDTVKIK